MTTHTTPLDLDALELSFKDDEWMVRFEKGTFTALIAAARERDELRNQLATAVAGQRIEPQIRAKALGEAAALAKELSHENTTRDTRLTANAIVDAILALKEASR